jgi:hypothetical protein
MRSGGVRNTRVTDFRHGAPSRCAVGPTGAHGVRPREASQRAMMPRSMTALMGRYMTWSQAVRQDPSSPHAS